MCRALASRFVLSRFSAVLILTVGFAARTFAQPAGSVAGIVADPLGARVAGATVTLTREGRHRQ